MRAIPAILLLPLLLPLAACDSFPVVLPPSGDVISGIIPRWNPARGPFVFFPLLEQDGRLDFLDFSTRGLVSLNGSFSAPLVEVAVDSLLFADILGEASCSASLPAVVPGETLGVAAFANVREPAPDEITATGMLVNFIPPARSVTGEIQVLWAYVESPIELRGACTLAGTSPEEGVVTFFDLQLPTGWSPVVRTVLGLDELGRRTIELRTEAIPEDVVWEVVSD